MNGRIVNTLSWFGDKEVQAKKAYRQYVKEGIGWGDVRSW
jgi:hypothetical protein